MKIRTSLALGAAVTITTLTITGGVAQADVPGVAPQPSTTVATDVAPGTHYTAAVVDHSVVLRTDAGRLNVRGNQFENLDDNGNLVAGLPLTYKLDQKDWPIAAQVDGRTAVLTPSRNPATPGPPQHLISRRWMRRATSTTPSASPPTRSVSRPESESWSAPPQVWASDASPAPWSAPR